MYYRMNICTALNDAYVKYTCVMLRSLFINNPDANVHVYLLYCELSDESKQILKEFCDSYFSELNIIEVDPAKYDVFSFLDRWGGNGEAAFRLELMDRLPSDIDRILYLDVDMIINKSLKRLYLANLDGYDMAAAYDMPLIDESKLELYKATRHPILHDTITKGAYFCSGMILFNADAMRGKYTVDDYLKAAKDMDYKILYIDQDILNAVHQGRVMIVDPFEFNFFAPIGPVLGYDYEKTKTEVSIVHFIEEKPWCGYDHEPYPIEQLWWDYALMDSRFKDECLENYVLETVRGGK